jgi:integrase/recombinase XerD
MQKKPEIKTPKKRRREWEIGPDKILTADEQQVIRDYLVANSKSINGKKTLIIVGIMLNTGLRASELCSLRACDMPAVLGSLNVRVYKGKGNKDRTVPISQRLANAIAEYIEKIRPKTLPRYVLRSDIRKKVFYSQAGRPYNRNGIYKMISRLGIKAGLAKKVYPHMLRHTRATQAIIMGLDLARVKRLMGHSSLNVTSRYVHVVEDMMKGVGEQIDIVF